MVKVIKYFDVICDECGFSLSEDFYRGMAMSAAMARKWAKEEGFREIKGRTLCPGCIKLLKSSEK